MTDLDKLEALDMPGMTVTIVGTPIEPYFAIRKWENDGLEGGTHRLVAEPVARTEIARLQASARRDAEEIERLRGGLRHYTCSCEPGHCAMSLEDDDTAVDDQLCGRTAQIALTARAAHTGEGTDA